MSTRDTNFLHQWISNNVPDTGEGFSVAELTHKMFEDAKAIGLSQGEVEEDTGSAYEAIHDTIVQHEGGVGD